MKIWCSYGSEHSANLVMIGTFRDVPSAKKAKGIIDELTAFMADADDERERPDRYSSEELDFLMRIGFHSVGSGELEQFRYDVNVDLQGSQIIVRTDEIDVSGFLKVLIDKGARVEVYSAHDYPDKKSTDDSQ
jgi:hypothetical protein